MYTSETQNIIYFYFGENFKQSGNVDLIKGN